MAEENKVLDAQSLLARFEANAEFADVKAGFESYETPQEVSEAELLVYENYRANGDKIIVTFGAVSAEGEYVHNENGVSIRAKMQDILPYKDMEAQTFRRANYLNREIEVTVKEVDSENGIVWVEAEKKDRVLSVAQQERAVLSNYFTELYFKARRENTEFRIEGVGGTVISVGERYVLLAVGGCNILARVNVGQWSKGYIRDLTKVVFKGENYRINIIGRRTLRGSSAVEWLAEHESYTSNPWDGIPDYVKPGMSLSVTCVQVDEEQNRWWAIPADNSIIPSRIEILCTFKGDDNNRRGNGNNRGGNGNNNSGRFPVEVGKDYQVTLTSVSASQGRLRASSYRPNTRDAKVGVHKVEETTTSTESSNESK